MLLFFSNFTVMVFKFGAYLYTGSASMLSEAVHSLADFANQVRRHYYTSNIFVNNALIMKFADLAG